MREVRASISVIILLIQVKIVISSRTTVLTANEGLSVNFSCEYPAVHLNNSKFFCQARPTCSSYLIHTRPHEQWVTQERFSLQDNLTAGQFVVTMDRVQPEDSGTYWCGVKIQDEPDHIHVFRLSVTHTRPNSTSNPNIIVDKHNLPLFMTVASCLSALLVVFLFTLCLVFTFRTKKRTSIQRARPEMSSDYEVMKSGVSPELKLNAVAPDVSTGRNVPAGVSPYQELDLSSVEEHVYHGINSR